MTSKQCIQILQTMAIGCTEKEAIEFAIKKIKKAKKHKKRINQIKDEILYMIEKEEDYNGPHATAQIVTLEWVLEVIDKYTKCNEPEWHADPYHADWALDIKAALDGLTIRKRKESE